MNFIAEKTSPQICHVFTYMTSLLACAQTKLNSGELRLRNSAEILVLDFQLCTQIWVRATIGQLKKAFVLFVVIANQVEGKFETHFR